MVILTVVRQCSFCYRFSTVPHPPHTHQILTRTGKLRLCQGRYRPIPPRQIEVRL